MNGPQNLNQTPAQGENKISIRFLNKRSVKVMDGSNLTLFIEFNEDILDYEPSPYRYASENEVKEIIEYIKGLSVTKVEVFMFIDGYSKSIIEASDDSISIYAGESEVGSGFPSYLTIKLDHPETPIYLNADLIDVIQGKMSIEDYVLSVINYWLDDIRYVTNFIFEFVKQNQ